MDVNILYRFLVRLMDKYVSNIYHTKAHVCTFIIDYIMKVYADMYRQYLPVD